MTNEEPRRSGWPAALGWLAALALLLTLGWGSLLLCRRFAADLKLAQRIDAVIFEAAWVYIEAWLSLRPCDPAWPAVAIRAGVLLLVPTLMTVTLVFGALLAGPLMLTGLPWPVPLATGMALVAGGGMTLLQHLTENLTLGGDWTMARAWLVLHLLGAIAGASLLLLFQVLADRYTARSWLLLAVLPHALVTAALAARDAPDLRRAAGRRAIAPFLLLLLLAPMASRA